MKTEWRACFDRWIQARSVAVIALIFIAIIVRAPDMSRVKRTGFDESAYVFFSQVWNEKGVGGIRQLLAEYPHDDRLQRAPLPLRIAFIAAGSATCRAMGGYTRDNLAWLSFGAGIAIVAAGTLFAWEMTASSVIGWLTGLLLIASPLAGGLSLRATQDTMVGLIIILALWLFYRASRRSTWWNNVLLGLCLLVGFLTKETMAFAYPLMGCMLAWQWFVGKRKVAWHCLLPLALAPILYLAVAAALCGGLDVYLSTYRFYGSLQEKLVYTTRYEKGPWDAYFVDFLTISPLVFFAAIAGLAGLGSSPKERENYGLSVLLFVGSCLLFGLLPVINVRLVLFADFFLRFAAAASIVMLARQHPRWMLLSVPVVCVLLTGDWIAYQHIFIAGKLYSPTHFLLFRATGFYDVEVQ